LSSYNPSDVSELLASWSEIIKMRDGEEYIDGENDTFHLEKPERWSMGSLANAVTSIVTRSSSMPAESDADSSSGSDDRALDYNKVLKRLVAHEADLPSNKETPSFNHHAYFANLNKYNEISEDESGQEFGKYLLYGEVVTSTNTLLEK
jgi:biotin---protein ligase